MSELYTVPVPRVDGTEETLAPLEGKVLLIVNVASECGLTPQYEGLEKIYETYRDRGFSVLGFPANEFGAQEPGTNEEIQQFCRMRFDVKFPVYAKIVVKGEGQHPLYRYLTTARPDAESSGDGAFRADLQKYGLLTGQEQPNDILWNFEKFLVNRHGEVVRRFAPDVTPDDPLLIDAIEAELSRD